MYNDFIRIKPMATNHRKMTCKEALKARYKVVGRKENGYSESAVCLSYEEARRFWDSLTFREFDSIKAIAYWDEHVFYSG